MSEILNVDAMIVSHTHADHWDDAAKKLVPKDTLLFAQNEKDAEEIRGAGFRNVRALEETNEFDGITMIKTVGEHGRGKVLEGLVGELLGKVSGIVFKHPSEKTLYIAGDTVWCRGVDESLKKYDADIVVLWRRQNPAGRLDHHDQAGPARSLQSSSSCDDHREPHGGRESCHAVKARAPRVRRGKGHDLSGC